MTFRDRLLKYYASHHLGGAANTFMAFVLILQCIDYTCSVDFCYKICGYSPVELRRLHFLILSNNITKKLPKAYRISKVNMFSFILILMDLRIRISRNLVNRIKTYVTPSQSNEIEYLCNKYFELVKNGMIDKILGMEEADRIMYFSLYCKKPKLKTNKRKNTLITNTTDSSFYYRIGDFKAYYSHSNNMWGDKIPFHLKSIPMGGSSKKY